MVPLYEELEAAKHSLINPQTWTELHYSERALAVAHYRTHLLVEQHLADAAEQERERERRKQNRRGGRKR